MHLPTKVKIYKSNFSASSDIRIALAMKRDPEGRAG